MSELVHLFNYCSLMGEVVNHKVLLVGTLGGPLDNSDCSVYLCVNPLFSKEKSYTATVLTNTTCQSPMLIYFIRFAHTAPSLKKKKSWTDLSFTGLKSAK